MASPSNSRKSTSDMPPPAVPFSYAQAAKGMSTASSSSPQASRLPSGSVTPAKEGGTPSAPLVSEMPAGSSWPDDGDHGSVGGSAKSTQTSESTVIVPAQRQAAQPNGVASPGSPEFGTSSVSTLPREDDSSSARNFASSESTWESKSQSSLQEKGGDTAEIGDDKEQEKGKRKTDQASPIPKPVLHDAPIPSINIWKQRAAEQQKGKSVTPANPAASAPAAPPTAPPSNEPIKFETGRSKSTDASETLRKASEQRHPKNDGDRNADDTHPRNQRVADSQDKVDRTAMSAPLPSLGDSESWPTPFIAQDDDQRRTYAKPKVNDREGNVAAPPSKAKPNWVAVPINPTVIFNTPLPNTHPRRGGRGGGRGGREGGGRGGPGKPHRDGDKSETALSTLPNGEPSGRRGRPQEPGRSSSPTKARRTVSDELLSKREHITGPHSSREPFTREEGSNSTSVSAEQITDLGMASQEPNGVGHFASRSAPRQKQPRRQEGVFHGERRREAEPTGYGAANESETHYSRRPSTSSYAAMDVERKVYAPKEVIERPGAEIAENDERKAGSFEVPANPRTQTSERRNGPYSTFSNRERDPRGRPGRRSGGLALAQPTQGHQLAGTLATSHNVSSFAALRSPTFPESFSGQVGQRGRQYTGPNRSQSIPSDHILGRFTNGYPASALPPLQTGYMPPMGVYDYSQLYPMSAAPYGLGVDQVTIANMVTTQLEYYLSIDNLIKDVYLRKHMDSEGFVLLSFVADFNRLKQISTDFDIVRAASQHSAQLEYRLGADGKDRIRKKEGWEKWILPISERDTSAQNDGPGEFAFPTAPHPHINTSLPLRHASLPIQSPMSAPAGFPPLNGTPAFSSGFVAHDTHSVNGLGLQTSPTTTSQPTELFAGPNQTPVVSPSAVDASHQHRRVEQEADTFPSAEAGALVVVWRRTDIEGADNGVQLPQLSKTLSNGSLGGRTHPEEPSINNGDPTSLPNGHPPTNEDELPRRSSADSRETLIAQTKSAARSTGEEISNIFWVKDKDSPAHELPENTSSVPYAELHTKALQERRAASTGTCPYDMIVLYQFWSHFLVRNFNTEMYDEFRTLAFGDKEHGSDQGLVNLVKFYDTCVYSSKIQLRARVARHYVDLAKRHHDVAFEHLRRAWRDGALPLKNRSVLHKYLDPDFKATIDPVPAPSGAVASPTVASSQPDSDATRAWTFAT